ncbi:hypothetical protein LC653_37985 [Nostoc sp. CHAB 5784]|uniref:hypothetical protein n=1 Tax=Nostoc mirabile TaxID=2907820 RepID=UPI001E5D7AA2|nr:hypothetical protein [Nostoc mirabile]MCC5669472.1 hypothetical protein [Nostoc mirabile CHAB5784]
MGYHDCPSLIGILFSCKSLTIHDSTLRDGQHAVRHQLTLEKMCVYAEAANAAGIAVVEVGHGNGLSASSLQVGIAQQRPPS